MPINEASSRPSTFVQDNSSPIYVSIEYDRGGVTFPVNPETLKQGISSQSVTENIEALGQISIPQRPSLSEITFNSFFWGDLESKDKPKRYIEWLKRWQRSRKPAHLIVSRLDWFSMDVTCENLVYWVNAGEEDDIYFEITLKEYKEYKAQEVKILSNGTVQGITSNGEVVESERLGPVLIEAPKQTRNNINKPPVPSVIETKDDDSIVSIVRKNNGDTKNWEELYENNRATMSEMVSDGVVTANIPLETPKSWNPTQFTTPTFSVEKALKKSKVMSSIFKKLDQLSALFNDVKSLIEDIEQTEGAMQEFLTKMGELYNIFTPENCLDGVNIIKTILEDLKAVAEIPEQAVASLDQMIVICTELAKEIAEFVSEW